jgi:hypothetical protein
MAHTLLVGFLVGIALLGVQASAQEQSSIVRFMPPKPTGAEPTHVKDYGFVEISGDIQRSAVSSLTVALVKAKRLTKANELSGDPVVLVFLNSRGGEITAAIEMGKLLRANAANVWIDSSAECSSACVLVLAGGVSRSAAGGAKIGLHRPFYRPSEFAALSYSDSQNSYTHLAKTVKTYLSEMGIADGLFDAMMRVPSNHTNFVSLEVAEDWHLLGKDPAYEEWQRARALQTLGRERQEMLDRYLDCVSTGRPEKACEPLLDDF